MIGPSNTSNLSQFFKICPVLDEFGYCSCEIIIANPTALREMGKAQSILEFKKLAGNARIQTTLNGKDTSESYKSFNVVSFANVSGNSPVNLLEVRCLQ